MRQNMKASPKMGTKQGQPGGLTPARPCAFWLRITNQQPEQGKRGAPLDLTVTFSLLIVV